MLGAESAALILDDTAGVWPRHGGNLLQLPRYIFFPADHSRWAVCGGSLPGAIQALCGAGSATAATCCSGRAASSSRRTTPGAPGLSTACCHGLPTAGA